MKTKILQKLADYILHKVKTCDKNHVLMWYNVGMMLDKIAIKFKVELK